MKAKKLPSGSYRVQVVAGYDVKGKRVVKSFTADTEWKALKMAQEFKDGVDADRDHNITLRRATEIYIDSRRNLIEETTISNYEEILRNKLQLIMDTRIKDLKVIQVQQAINVDAQSLSAKSVRNAFGLIKSVLKFHECSIYLDNIKLPKIVRKEKELPTFETVFNIVKGTASELPALLAAWLSLRIGEVIGLQFRDVDKDKGIIKIRRTIIMTSDGEKVRDGCKTEKSTRNLQLPPYIMSLISAIPHESETDSIIPKSRRAVYGHFTKLMSNNGIKMTFHDLRHLNASVMLMLGVPDKYACERGGWSTDSILKSVYQQTFSAERKKVDCLIDNYFGGIVEHLTEGKSCGKTKSHGQSHESA